MEIITIETQAFKDIMNKIDEIGTKVELALGKPILGDDWLDIQDTCQILKVSKRTLQTYRDQGILSFSQVNGKIYFKASDLRVHLEKHYIKAFKRP
jgi:hypothetical protein